MRIINLLQVLKMNVPKGGRGHTVPYKSKVLRVPEPILEDVEKLIDNFYSQTPNSSLIDSTAAVLIAKDILTQNKVSKRPTKNCLEKLLQSLYGDKSINL